MTPDTKIAVDRYRELTATIIDRAVASHEKLLVALIKLLDLADAAQQTFGHGISESARDEARTVIDNAKRWAE